VGGAQQLDRSVAIHRQLATGPATGSSAGGEDHSVCALDRGGDLLDTRAL
jgi:hypothetical protein